MSSLQRTLMYSLHRTFSIYISRYPLVPTNCELTGTVTREIMSGKWPARLVLPRHKAVLSGVFFCWYYGRLLRRAIIIEYMYMLSFKVERFSDFLKPHARVFLLLTYVFRSQYSLTVQTRPLKNTFWYLPPGRNSLSLAFSTEICVFYGYKSFMLKVDETHRIGHLCTCTMYHASFQKKKKKKFLTYFIFHYNLVLNVE